LSETPLLFSAPVYVRHSLINNLNDATDAWINDRDVSLYDREAAK